MKNSDPQKKTNALTTVIVCALVFVCFSFSWLYWFQADVLTVAQHILSNGQTHYNPFVGALLITVILMVVQQGVYAVVRLSRRTHALTYFPSFQLLAMLSCLGPGTTRNITLGAWLWAAPLLLIVWGFCVWLAKQILPFENDFKQPTGLFSRRMWLNLLQMALMMLFVAAAGNTNAVYHYRTHAEVALLHDNTDEALRVGRRSLETDEHLTMLRLFALSKQGLIGDSLFTYALAGSSTDMLPLKGSRSKLLILPNNVLWQHFGSYRPTKDMTVRQYLDSVAVDTLATRAYIDYKLAGLLLDRQVDSFAVAVTNYYPLHPDSLPRHYREALLLSVKQSGDTVPTLAGYRDSIMELRWDEMKSVEELCSNQKERQIKVFDKFRSTYWYYFLYGKK